MKDEIGLVWVFLFAHHFKKNLAFNFNYEDHQKISNKLEEMSLNCA